MIKNCEMFEKMIKCQQDRFWAENLILDAITNWISKKYNIVPKVTLEQGNFINVEFLSIDMRKHDEIMTDICQEFKLEICDVFLGCHYHYKDNVVDRHHKFQSYKLHRSDKYASTA